VADVAKPIGLWRRGTDLAIERLGLMSGFSLH
jgi:hypothetical protein